MAAQFKLIELTIIESVQKLSDLETEFISKFSLYTVQEGNFQFFRLKSRFFNFCESFIPDFENLHYLLQLNESEDDVSEEKDLENDSSVEIRDVNTSSFDIKLNVKANAAKMLNN